MHSNRFSINTKKVGLYSLRLLFLLFGLSLISACTQEKTAEQHMQEANNFLQQDDKKAAIVSLKNTIQLAPNNAEARYLLGSLQFEFDLYDEASKELSRALGGGYAEEKIIPLLANALERANANVELSALEFDASKLSNDEQAEVGFRKLQAMLTLEENEAGAEYIKTLEQIDSNSIYKSMIMAYQLLLEEKAEEAHATIAGLLKGNENNTDLVSFLSRLELLIGNTDEALRLLERYIKLATYDVRAKFLFVNLLVQEKQTQRAEPYVDEMLELNTDNPMLNQLKAIIRMSEEDFIAADEFSGKAILAGRNDNTLFLVAGLSAYQLKDYQKAVTYLSLIESSMPADHPALRMLAASYLQIDEYTDASDVLSRLDSGAESEGDMTLLSRAGYDLIKAGELDRANDIIARAEEISTSAEDMTQLGVLKLSMGDIEGLADLEKAVATSPESATARATLSNVYLDTNQLDKAMTMAKKWQSERPDAVDGYLLEARVLQRQQKFEESKVIVKKVEQIAPENIDVRLMNIVFDLQEEKYTQGKGKVEKLLQSAPNNPRVLSAYYLFETALDNNTKSIQLIKEAAQNNKENQALNLLYAEVLAAQDKYAEAVDALSHIEPSRMTPTPYFELKAKSLVLSRQDADAYEHFKQWIALFPDNELAVRGQLKLLDRIRRYDEAVQVATDFLSRNESVQVLITQAYFMSMTRDASGAQTILNSLDNTYLQIPFVRGIKARVALLTRKGASAVEDAKAAYEESPTAPNLLVYKRILDSADKPDQAYDIVFKHAKNYPDDLRGLSLLAEEQIARDPDAALQTYEEILAKAPNNPLILNNAAYLYSQAGNVEKALDYGQKAHTALPENVNFADTYAYILVGQDRAKEAVDIYNSVMTDDVNDETMILNFVEALLKNGDKQSARRRIQLYNFKLKSPAARERLLVLQSMYLN